MLLKQIRGYLGTAPSEDLEQDDHPERRRARRRAVFLKATVYPIDVFCDALVCDVSENGIRGEADVELAIGQIMHITLDQLAYHAGTVKWVRDRQFGLALPNALTLFGLASEDVDHGIWEGHQPRDSRLQISATARLLSGQPPRPATIKNVSSTGMLLETSPGLRAGQHVIVRAGNMQPIYGRVQWRNDARIGFKAQNPISILSFVCSED